MKTLCMYSGVFSLVSLDYLLTFLSTNVTQANQLIYIYDPSQIFNRLGVSTVLTVSSSTGASHKHRRPDGPYCTQKWVYLSVCHDWTHEVRWSWLNLIQLGIDSIVLHSRAGILHDAFARPRLSNQQVQFIDLTILWSWYLLRKPGKSNINP
jgi:hypothetical protein